MNLSKAGTLTLTNESTELPCSVWIMGEGGDAGVGIIGQFHEGLKIASMVLCRMGHGVTMYSGEEKWTPVLEPNDKFNGVPILTIKRRKVQARRDFTIQVEGIAEEQFEEVKRLYLDFDDRFDNAQVMRTAPWEGSARVLLQEEFRGCLYSKGVFIQKKPDLMYGYEIDAEINRDRSILDDWDTRYYVGEALKDACVYEESKFEELVFPQLCEGGNAESTNEYSQLINSTKFQQMVQAYWDDHYGLEAVAVTDASQQEQAIRLGLRAIITTPLIRRVVDHVYGSASNRMSAESAKVEEVIEPGNLAVSEAANWEMALKMAQTVHPDLRKHTIRVAYFKGKDVPYHTDEESGVLYVGRCHLASPKQSLKAAAHVVAEIEGNSSYENQMDVMARMLLENCQHKIDIESLRRLILGGA
jgi:hypothetical protein